MDSLLCLLGFLHILALASSTYHWHALLVWSILMLVDSTKQAKLGER